jgi:Arc/MetJ-type ribon-helix-helix transcriptional regulator
MKLSISLPDEDVAALDDHIQRAGLRSRSAAIHQAIRLLRRSELEDDYAAAWEDWDSSGDRESWEITNNDGLA